MALIVINSLVSICAEVPISCAPQSAQKSSPNPFLSLLNALGFLGSGVLAALYASLQKEKAASDANIESVSIFQWSLKVMFKFAISIIKVQTDPFGHC